MKTPAKRRPLTPRHHAYVEHLLAGKSGRQAAIDAGFAPGSASSRSLELNKHPEVIAALEAGRLRLQKSTDYTVDVAMKDLDKAMDFAVKANSPTAYVKAIEAKARMVGILDKQSPLLGVFSVDLNEVLQKARGRMLGEGHHVQATAAIEDAQIRAPQLHIPSDRDVDLQA